MTVRNKSLIIIITISLLMISLVNASAHFILVKSFENLEETHSSKNIQRVLKTIENEKNHLATLVVDYAIWDDTYRFVKNFDQGYLDSNIQPSTFTSLNLNFFIFTDNSGQVIASYGYDLVHNSPQAVRPEILDLVSGQPLFHNAAVLSPTTGIVSIHDQPILIAFSPILTSRSSGPPHGFLTIGRFLGDDFTRLLAETSQLSIESAPAERSVLSGELASARQMSGGETKTFVKVLNAQSVAGYALITDLFGSPVLVLRSVMDRDIYNQGYATILFFIYVVFFGSLFFVIIAIFLLDKQVISRITGLSKSVVKVRLSGALVERVVVKGKDEIGSLAKEINEMLQSLEDADYKLRHSRAELEDLVNARTAELVQVNEALNYEIVERELGQKALSDAYNEIHQIISSISSIMIGVDDDRMVTLWNDVAAKSLGLTQGQVIGRDFFGLAIDWDWERISRETTECLNSRKQVRMEDVCLKNQADSPRILGITLTPLFLNGQDQPGFLLIGADITERRSLEQQLGRSSKMEAIGQLAAGVAHEINTPTQLVGSNLRFLGRQLQTVLTLIDKVYQLNRAVKNGSATTAMALALEKDASAAQLDYFRQEAPKAVEQSLEGIERISYIISAMRFFTHPGSEKKVLANLNQIIQNALSLSLNEWKNVADIQTDLAPDLPSLECLPVELSQVVLNIIVNAVHAIQDAAGELPETRGRIGITSRLLGEWVEVRISDSGTGIPNEIRDKIFDPFFTTKDVGRGTGQGLAIAYTVIVKQHGGTIEFESETGRGTTFIIRLPRKADDGSENSLC